MKRLNQLFDHSYRYVTIKWHKPVLLPKCKKAEFEIDQKNIFLYKIIGKRGDTCKLFYIGKSERQNIEDRLYNNDHRLKQEVIREKNKNYALYCSLGEFIEIEDDRKSCLWPRKHVPLIENLLIIAHSEIGTLHNRNGINWYSSDRAWIMIENSGFLQEGMFKTVSYGLFTSKNKE